MPSDTSYLDLDLDLLYLEIDPALPAQVWQQSQFLATPASRWSAYLNQLTLQTLLPWLTEEVGTWVQPMLKQALLPTVWEWVSGTAVNVDDWRLVLLPVEAMDADEFRVPQEWVDMPEWLGDYYLQVQVNPDEGWVKVAGMATHQMLKEQGVYDWRDRTYALPASDLISDVNVMAVSQALCPAAAKRSAVAPVPALSLAQANQLMSRLSDPSLLNPRLAVDFSSWSALMAHGGWRRQMAQQRWGRPAASVSQWLQSGLTQFAQQLGWQEVSFRPEVAGARGEAIAPQAGLARPVEIVDESYVLQISPITDQANQMTNSWRFELHNLNGVVAPGITLRLLTEDLQPFEGNEAIAAEPIEALYVEVALERGEGLVWEIDPTPDQYEPEILRF